MDWHIVPFQMRHLLLCGISSARYGGVNLFCLQLLLSFLLIHLYAMRFRSGNRGWDILGVYNPVNKVHQPFAWLFLTRRAEAADWPTTKPDEGVTKIATLRSCMSVLVETVSFVQRKKCLELRFELRFDRPDSIELWLLCCLLSTTDSAGSGIFTKIEERLEFGVDVSLETCCVGVAIRLYTGIARC